MGDGTMLLNTGLGAIAIAGLVVPSAIVAQVEVAPLPTDADFSLSIPTTQPDPYFPIGPTLISLGSVAVTALSLWLKSRQSLSQMELRHLSELREDLQGQMKDWIRQQLDEKESEIGQLRDRVTLLEAQLRQLEQAKSAREAEVAQLQATLENLKHRHSKQLQVKEAEIRQLLDQIKRIEHTKSEQESQLQELKARHQQLISIYKTLKPN